MDVKEKLIEIIQNSVGGCARHWAEIIADGLISHGVTVQEWISVEERFPTENGTYLVVGKSGTVCTAHFYPGQALYGKTYPCHFSNRYVRFWARLPDPPKGGE
jgi:hypothetical protein